MINSGYFHEEEKNLGTMSFLELQAKREEYLAEARRMEKDYEPYLPDGRIPWREDQRFIYTWYMKAVSKTAVLMAQRFAELAEDECGDCVPYPCPGTDVRPDADSAAFESAWQHFGRDASPAGGISVVKGDVSATDADAIVNAANERLLAGGGICGAIFRRAGFARLQAACDKVAPCPTGEARVTPAFGIANAKFIIHAVGPRYVDGRHGEPELLASCYRNLLAAAVENGCKSVAVPSISTGIFGYPLEDAAAIAVRETKAFLAEHPDLRVIFVAWDDRTEKLYGELV